MSDEYTHFVKELLSENQEWAKPFVTSWRARILFLALFTEGLRAVEGARMGGTFLTFYEWTTADCFDLKINTRAVRFERLMTGDDDKRIRVSREGFSPALVPWATQQEMIAAPADPRQAEGIAREQIRLALALLLRDLD